MQDDKLVSTASRSRRDFLRLSAAGLAGAAAGSSEPLSAGVSPKALAAAPKDVSPRELTFDVKTFGAKGDGTTIDTPAINKAIETAARAGGGVVRFPAGVYSCFQFA